MVMDSSNQIYHGENDDTNTGEVMVFVRTPQFGRKSLLQSSLEF